MSKGMHKKFLRFLSIQIIRKVGVTMHSNCNQMNQHCICCWQATTDKLLRSSVRECAFLSVCLWKTRDWCILPSRFGNGIPGHTTRAPPYSRGGRVLVSTWVSEISGLSGFSGNWWVLKRTPLILGPGPKGLHLFCIDAVTCQARAISDAALS